MSKKFTVETAAVINDNPVGSTIELSESSAKKLADKNYVKIIGEVKKPAKKASAPKKPAKKQAPKKNEKKDDKKSE